MRYFLIVIFLLVFLLQFDFLMFLKGDLVLDVLFEVCVSCMFFYVVSSNSFLFVFILIILVLRFFSICYVWLIFFVKKQDVRFMEVLFVIFIIFFFVLNGQRLSKGLKIFLFDVIMLDVIFEMMVGWKKYFLLYVLLRLFGVLLLQSNFFFLVMVLDMCCLSFFIL